MHFKWKMLLIPIFILALLFLMQKVPNAVGTFLAGFVLYLILDPMVDMLNKKYKSRVLLTLIVFIFVFVVFSLVLMLLNYLVKVELPRFMLQIPAFMASVKMLLAEIDARTVFIDNLSGGQIKGLFSTMFNNLASQNAFSSVVSGSTAMLMKIMTVSFDLVMALIISAYLIIDEPRILNFIEENLPRRIMLLNRQMWHEMLRTISGYVIGLLILGTIIFTISWIGLLFAGVPYAFTLSVWGGMTIIIPYIGPFIGSIPAIAVAFTKGIWLGASVAVFLTILQFVVTSVIGPKILGEIIGVHPVIVILALIVGGELGGMAGMILAVPLTSILIIFLRYYWPMFTED